MEGWVGLDELAFNSLDAPNIAEIDALATEAGNAEIWIAQIFADWVPDGRTNHGEHKTAVRVELYLWRTTDQWNLQHVQLDSNTIQLL